MVVFILEYGIKYYIHREYYKEILQRDIGILYCYYHIVLSLIYYWYMYLILAKILWGYWLPTGLRESGRLPNKGSVCE